MHTGITDTLFYQYRVERIHHDRGHMYAALFNQNRFFRDESSYDISVNKIIGGQMTNSQPVIFIVLTNCPQSIPVGFIQLYSVFSSINETKTTIVNDLFVLPDYRYNGLALKLIEAAVKFSISNKSAEIQLETSQDDLITRKLYESVGFSRQSSKPELNLYSIKFESDR